jgi:hypothetical protein
MAAVQRIKVDSLTQEEKKGLSAQGVQVPSEGFVDVPSPEKVELVDMRSEKRKEAISQLKSVESVIPRDRTPTEDEAKNYEKFNKQIAELENKIRERKLCPRCGHDHDNEYKVEASKEDIEDFLRSTLGGHTFSKVYSLMGGKLVLKLRTHKGSEDELIRNSVSKMLKTGEVLPDEVYIRITTYSLAVSLEEFGDIKYAPIDVSKFDVEITERINSIPSHVLTILKKQLQRFNELVDLLVQRIQDPSFWTGTDASV